MENRLQQVAPTSDDHEDLCKKRWANGKRATHVKFCLRRKIVADRFPPEDENSKGNVVSATATATSFVPVLVVHTGINEKKLFSNVPASVIGVLLRDDDGRSIGWV